MVRSDVESKAGMPERRQSTAGGTRRCMATERQTTTVTEENAGPPTTKLMEEVLRRENLIQALKRVRSNRGAPGVDGMTVTELSGYLKREWPHIREMLLHGTYIPKPVRVVEIPKPNGGGMRMLGIPTVLDRMIQQAILQIIGPIFDATFSDASFGFRPGRSAHQAVALARKSIEAGYRFVVDIDLEKFLDLPSHYPLADGSVSNRPGSASGTLIRSPCRRPRRTWTASSSPRFTRCNTVWRETPRSLVARIIGT